MKCSLTFSLLVSCALLGLGAAIKCFSCKDDKASCNEQRNCIYENACLTFVETGGMTYRQCHNYTNCGFKELAALFPQVAKFTSNCCNTDLCNSTPSTAASSLIGVLATLLLAWLIR